VKRELSLALDDWRRVDLVRGHRRDLPPHQDLPVVVGPVVQALVIDPASEDVDVVLEQDLGASLIGSLVVLEDSHLRGSRGRDSLCREIFPCARLVVGTMMASVRLAVLYAFSVASRVISGGNAPI